MRWPAWMNSSGFSFCIAATIFGRFGSEYTWQRVLPMATNLSESPPAPGTLTVYGPVVFSCDPAFVVTVYVKVFVPFGRGTRKR